MEEYLLTLLRAVLNAVYILLLPFFLLLATPFIVLWPGKRLARGKRAARNIKQRYLRIIEAWHSVGLGLLT